MIASTLGDGGYIDGDVLSEPTGGLWSGHELWVVPCLDRVAVFSPSNSDLTLSEHAVWWAQKSCDTSAIDTLGFGSFRLSAALNVVSSCYGLAATPTTTSANGAILGTDGDDVIVGTPGPDIIRARKGNDIICGLSGDDIIYGGAGDDSIVPGTGTDIVWAGSGNDVGYLRALDDAQDTLDGQQGTDLVTDFYFGFYQFGPGQDPFYRHTEGPPPHIILRAFRPM